MEIQEIKSKLNSYNSDISNLENEYQEKKNELEQVEKSEVSTIQERKDKSTKIEELEKEVKSLVEILENIKVEKENFCNSQVQVISDYLAKKRNEKEKNEEKTFNENLKSLINSKLEEITNEAKKLDEKQKKQHDDFFKEIKEMNDIVEKVSINYFDIFESNINKARIYISKNMI
ncbi:hypothetical protein [Gemella cuniculi]|uniref:hypothetical protein n=1 Tax=Gemella cuniculi TaxID=150240 RepID=UPI0004023B9B|nr:hypothetical protein [Gemella cuniculi]